MGFQGELVLPPSDEGLDGFIQSSWYKLVHLIGVNVTSRDRFVVNKPCNRGEILLPCLQLVQEMTIFQICARLLDLAAPQPSHGGRGRPSHLAGAGGHYLPGTCRVPQIYCTVPAEYHTSTKQYLHVPPVCYTCSTCYTPERAHSCTVDCTVHLLNSIVHSTPGHL